MEANEPIINLDYIAILSEKDDHLYYSRVNIEQKNIELIGDLSDMQANPNCSVLDMQGKFTMIYPAFCMVRGKEIKARTYDYCYPNSYKSSYINEAEYPILYSYDTYQRELEKIEEKEKAELEAKFESGQIKIFDPEVKADYIENYIKDKVNIFFNRCKYDFKKSAERYIHASNYYQALKLVKIQDENKMYSTENVGWTHFQYNVNGDLQFEVRTNFGYGWSSYFFVKMIYKGIDILPYSEAVEYYYAKMRDFVRYTRMYDPKYRDSWNYALNFVSDVTNLTVDDPDAFVQRWIIDECDQMMSGLRRIYKEPDKVLMDMIKFKRKTPDCILYIRNISKSEEVAYRIYKEEMEIAFKVEKITGAILLIKSLLSLESIYANVLSYVDEIKRMATSLIPVIDQMTDIIRIEITESRMIIDKNQFQLEKMRELYPTEFEEISSIVSATRYSSDTNKLTEYMNSHKYIKEYYERYIELEHQNMSESASIQERNRFIFKLETGSELIASLDTPVE